MNQSHPAWFTVCRWTLARRGTRRAAVAAALLAVAACGRVGYDGARAADAGATDAIPVPPGDDAPFAADASPDAPPDQRVAAGLPDAPGERPPVVPDAAADAVAAAAPDHCVAIPRLRDPPVIDGRVDGDLPLQAIPASAWSGHAPRLPPDQAVSFAAAWRPDGLYVFVAVQDPLIIATNDRAQWCQDAVTVFLDLDGVFASPPAYDATGTRQFTEGAPPGAAPRSHVEIYRMAEVAVVSSPRFQAFPAPGGYTVEAFLDASLMGTPVAFAAGGMIGFDLQTEHASQLVTTCDHDGSLILHRSPTGGVPSFDVAAFCTPRLAP